MSSYSLEFILFIDDTRAEIDWRHHLATHFRLRDLRREHSNFAEIMANPDFDRTRMDDPLEGFLYFPWQLQCSPVGMRTEPQQIELANKLRSHLEASGCRVVIAASFEDKL